MRRDGILVASLLVTAISGALYLLSGRPDPGPLGIRRPRPSELGERVDPGSPVDACSHPLLTLRVGTSWRYRVRGSEGTLPIETTVTIAQLFAEPGSVRVALRVQSPNGSFQAVGRCGPEALTDFAMIALGVPFGVDEGEYTIRDPNTRDEWTESAMVRLFAGPTSLRRQARLRRAEPRVVGGEEREMYEVLVDEVVGSHRRFVREEWARGVGLVSAEFGPSEGEAPYTVVELLEETPQDSE